MNSVRIANILSKNRKFMFLVAFLYLSPVILLYLLVRFSEPIKLFLQLHPTIVPTIAISVYIISHLAVMRY